jgi:hypothetical protein
MSIACSTAAPTPQSPACGSGAIQKKLPKILEKVMNRLPPGARVRLLFQDEARFGCISDQRRCWAPWPLRPIVGQQIIREFVYGLAAVSPLDGQLCSLILPWVDTETKSLFLAHAAACFPNDHCLMLLDGAGWHTAAALQVPPTLHLLPLPPYSPELNSVEHLWDHLRENYIGNQVFASLDAVVDHLCAGLRYLHQHREIVRSVTCFDWIKSLSLTLS